MANPKFNSYINDKVVVRKLQPIAEYPYLDGEHSVTYNLTLIARTESRSEDTHMEVNNFHTGVSIVSLPKNSCLEVFAHPSLYKNGYTLFGPLIIDGSYQGEIIIPLYKFKDVDCLELPFPAVQFVVKPIVPVHISSDEIKKKEESVYGGMSTIIYQAENSISSREPQYKGASSKRGGKSKGNHMF